MHNEIHRLLIRGSGLRQSIKRGVRRNALARICREVPSKRQNVPSPEQYSAFQPIWKRVVHRLEYETGIEVGEDLPVLRAIVAEVFLSGWRRGR